MNDTMNEICALPGFVDSKNEEKNRKKRRISCRITVRRRDAQTRHARRHPEDASQ